MAWLSSSSKNSLLKPSVSAVVCAYTEEKQLRYVLNQLLRFRLFGEVICVNDGSMDKTARIIKSFGQKVIPVHFEQNKGKSYAMAAGTRISKGEIIFFCDADLTSIKKSHVEGVVNPLAHNLADHALAIRPTEPAVFQRLTGERAVRKKDLLPVLKKMEKTKFGVEIFLNHHYQNKRTVWYYQKGLTQTNKNKRVRSLAGELLYADEYLREGLDILRQVIIQKNPKLTEEVNQLVDKMNSLANRFSSALQTPLKRKELAQLWKKEIKPLSQKLIRAAKSERSQKINTNLK
ncbi:glycosyltransferase [Patescibacteria group bacterium]|nr:glycosyltransferase [Patescibacteria group bacterium]